MKPPVLAAIAALAVTPALAGTQSAPEGGKAPMMLLDCILQEADFGYNLARKHERGANYFVTKKDGNAFQLCFRGRQAIYSQGLLVPGTLAEADGDLLFDTVMPKKMIPVDDVRSGQVVKGEWRAEGRGYELTLRLSHRVSFEHLKTEAEAGGDGMVLTMDKAAWASIGIEPQNGKQRSLQIRIKDDDASAAEKLVRRALALPKLEYTFNDAPSREAIVAYVKKELGRHAGKGLPMLKTPGIWIELVVNKSPLETDLPVVASILARGTQVGSTPNGEPIVDAMSYDDLVFCRQKTRLETRTEHNQHLAAAAAKAIGK